MFHTQLTYSNCVSRSLLLRAAWRACLQTCMRAHARTCTQVYIHRQQLPCSIKRAYPVARHPCLTFVLLHPNRRPYIAGALLCTQIDSRWYLILLQIRESKQVISRTTKVSCTLAQASARNGSVSSYIDDAIILSYDERSGIQQW